MTAIPTAEQLEPLYTVALAYGKASVEESRLYRQAGCQRTPAVQQAGRERARLYWEMDAAREAINAQFPGLNLLCPATFVGWTGELERYVKYVNEHLPDYVVDCWRDANEGEIRAMRELLRAIPETSDYQVGDFVFADSALYRVTRVSPKRRKVSAVALPDETEAQLRGQHKRIGKPLADRMLAMHASKVEALRSAGLAV